MRVPPCEAAWELMPLGECRGAWRSQLGGARGWLFLALSLRAGSRGAETCQPRAKAPLGADQCCKLRFFLVHAVIKAQVAANRRGVAHLALKARRWLGWEPDLSPIPLRL